MRDNGFIRICVANDAYDYLFASDKASLVI